MLNPFLFPIQKKNKWQILAKLFIWIEINLKSEKSYYICQLNHITITDRVSYAVTVIQKHITVRSTMTCKMQIHSSPRSKEIHTAALSGTFLEEINLKSEYRITQHLNPDQNHSIVNSL